MGGDDITSFLFALLEHVHFPYRDANLARAYDWSLMDDLKSRICTLAEVSAAPSFVLHRVDVRRGRGGVEHLRLFCAAAGTTDGKIQPARVQRSDPGAYGGCLSGTVGCRSLTTGQCIFEPRVLEFEHKKAYMQPLWNPGVGEEMVEQVGENEVRASALGSPRRLSRTQTQAMMISTQHLLPPPGPVPVVVPVSTSVAVPVSTFSPMDASAAARGRPVFAVAPQGAGDAGPPQMGSFAGRTPTKFISLDASNFEGRDRDAGKDATGTTDLTRFSFGIVTDGICSAVCARTGLGGGGIPDRRGVRGGEAATGCGDLQQRAGGGGGREDPQVPAGGAGGWGERAGAGDGARAGEPVRGARRGAGRARLTVRRLQAIASPLVPNMEKVQIIAPPRDVDPRELCWKGGAVLGKMDAVGDLWVGRGEWVRRRGGDWMWLTLPAGHAGDAGAEGAFVLLVTMETGIDSLCVIIRQPMMYTRGLNDVAGRGAAAGCGTARRGMRGQGRAVSEARSRVRGSASFAEGSQAGGIRSLTATSGTPSGHASYPRSSRTALYIRGPARPSD